MHQLGEPKGGRNWRLFSGRGSKRRIPERLHELYRHWRATALGMKPAMTKDTLREPEGENAGTPDCLIS